MLAAALGLAENDLAGIIINTCDAADLMGATPMDRPEWATVDPASGEVYLTLTNNTQRSEEGADATFTNDGSFEFACLNPGHYESGMHGPLTVAAE